MRLSAVYFPKDERFNNHTYNFGGCFSYKVDYSDNILKIERSKNNLYVDNFFDNEKITSISSIVGENGSGKTTFFKSLRDSESDCILIFEKDEVDQFIYHTKMYDFTGFFESDILHLLKLEFKNEFVEFNNYSSNSFKPEDTFPTIPFKVRKLYYFPNSVYDQQLNKIDDFVVKTHKNNLANIKSLTFNKQIRFLSDEPLVNKIRESYIEFPTYDSITIISSGVFMRDFKYHDIRKFAIENDLSDYDAEENARNKNIDLNGVFFYLNHIYDRSNKTTFKIFISIYYRLLYFFINNSNYSLVKVIGRLDELLKTHLNYFKNQKDDISIISELFDCFSNGVKFESTDDKDPDSVKKILTNFLHFINIVTEKTDLKNRNLDELTNFIFAYYELFDFFDKNIKSTNSKQEIDVSFLKFESGKNLSTGEISLLNFFSSIYQYRNENRAELLEEELLIFLLDEPELGFHPLWKKRFVNCIIKVLPHFFEHKQIQVIVSTHDPLTLSDFPISNTIFLNKMEGNCLKVAEVNIPKQTFGSNVNELLVNSFFLKDELIGDFAREKIEEVILQLNYFKLIKQKIEFENVDHTKEKLNKEELKRIAQELKDLENKLITKKITASDFMNEKIDSKVFKTINIIGEPVIRYKLLEMYDEIFIDNPKQIKAGKIKRLMEEGGLTIKDLS